MWDSTFRHDQELHLEGPETQLLSNILNAAFRPRDVLLFQQGKGRQDAPTKSVPGATPQIDRTGQDKQP